MDPLTYSKEKRQRPRHPSAQSFPDGTNRSHYLRRLCSGSQGNAALFHNRCFNDPNLFSFCFFLTRALISAESEEDGSPWWKRTLLTHRCGVTPTHLLKRINLPSPPPPLAPIHVGFLMILDPQAGRALCTDQRASFPLVQLAPRRSPVNCGTIFGTH